MEAEMKMALQPPRDLRAETCRLVIWGLVLAMLAWAWRGAEMKPMALVEQGGNILTLISVSSRRTLRTGACMWKK